MQHSAVIKSGTCGMESPYSESATNYARVGMENPLSNTEFWAFPHRNERNTAYSTFASDRAPPSNTKASALPAEFIVYTGMDRYVDRVPVRIEGSGTRYDGRVWYEHINSIKAVNGITVDTPLEKSGLRHEDIVTLEYEGKTFVGIIDLESTAVRSSSHPPNERQGAQDIEKPPGVSDQVSPRKRKSVAVSRLVDELELPAPPTAKKTRRKTVPKQAGW